MLRNFHYVPDFDANHPKTNLTGRSAWPTAPLFWSVVTALMTMCGAFCDGLAAHREYEHRRSMGEPHETAIREALGFAPCPPLGPPKTAKPLCFAGKA